MKKLLALVLALVMAMSLVTISNAAFADADEIDYTEAVEVMNAVGVLSGGDGNKFNPQAELTRAQAAKIIAYLDLGEKVAEALPAVQVYADVPASHWAAKYIAYCADAGYVSGVGDNKFAPDEKVTGYQFGKMLLCVLGYDAEIEKMTGENWQIAVAKLMQSNDINDGISKAASLVLTREEAAQYALNALKATCVEYEDKGTIIEGNGLTITTGGKKANNVTEAHKGTNCAYCSIDDEKDGTKDIVQLGEKLYDGDLVLDETEKTADKFGRPAHTWEYDGDEVGTYADTADLVYTGAEFDADLIEDLEEDYDFEDATGYYNGSKGEYTGIYNKDSKGLVNLNRNGYTIELFINDDDEVTEIVVTEAYVAEVTEINLDDDDEVDSVEVTVYEASKDGNGETITIDVEDAEDAYALIKDLEEDEVFVMFLAPGWDDADEDEMDEFLLAVDAVETVEGTVTATKLDNGMNGWIKVDGVKYEMAWEYSQASVKVDDEGSFYLYNGYVMHVDTESDDDDAYLYVVRTGKETNKWDSDTFYAEVVFTDGTSEVIEVAEAKDTDGNAITLANLTKGVYSYEYDKDDDDYALVAVDTDSDKVTITKGKTTVGSYTANSKTVYVNIELDGTAFDSAKVYTSYKTVPTMEDANVYVVADDTVLEYVFTVDASAKNEAEAYVYVVGASVSGKITEKIGDDEVAYYTYDAVVDGEIVEIMAEKDDLDGLYNEFEIDENGIYENFKKAKDNTDYWTISDTDCTVNVKKAADEVIKVQIVDKNGDVTDTEALPYADDVTVYVVDDDEVKTGSINKNYTGYTSVLYLTEDEADDDVTCIYIVK